MTDRDPLAPIEALADEWVREDDGGLPFSPDRTADLRAALAEARQAVGEILAEREQRHDDQCESEYETGAHAWTPCGCWASRSEAEGLVCRAEKAEAERDQLRAALAFEQTSRVRVADDLLEALQLGDSVSEDEARERLDGCDCNGEEGNRHLIWHLVQQRDAAREALARVEALAEEWETAHGNPPVDPSHISVRHAQSLRAALAQPATDEEAGQ